MPASSRLARLLQFTCAIQLAAAFGWLAWRWPVSPGEAIAGALLVLLIAPLVLGIELCIVAWIARSEASVPVPTSAQLLRAWLSESVHWYRTFCWRQPFRWQLAPDDLQGGTEGQSGVVLVHGFMCNRGFWNAWLRELRARGHACVAINLEPPFAAIDDCVPCIDEGVQRIVRLTGRPPVLVCHSMGGLAARAWWRASGGRHRVARIITIGSPHAGTWLARFSRRPNGRQMQLRSGWLRELLAAEGRQALPPVTCWYSNCDNVVFPARTATLDCADNRFIPGRAHVALAFDDEVQRGTLALIAAASKQRQGESVTGSAAEIG